jgi:hypothetical protein
MFEDEMHDLDDLELDHDLDGLPSLPDGGLCGPNDNGAPMDTKEMHHLPTRGVNLWLLYGVTSGPWRWT